MSRTHILADTTADTCLTGFGRPQRHDNSTRALEMQNTLKKIKIILIK